MKSARPITRPITRSVTRTNTDNVNSDSGSVSIPALAINDRAGNYILDRDGNYIVSRV